jgi:D-serine deaminase-like pyridoxal phosphate-dependent protein
MVDVPSAAPRRPVMPLRELEQLATPCLVVDRAALERNLARAADHFTTTRSRLRPHFKAHKCTTLLRRQVDTAPCTGVTCATAGEALLLARSGFGNILVANQVVTGAALAELGEAARRAYLTVAVDDAIHVELLARLATEAAVTFDVLIEIDVGLHRCGLESGSPALVELAASIERAPGLTLAGLQAYEGHAVFVADRGERRRLVAAAGATVEAECARLRAAGFPCGSHSGGATGTFDLVTDVDVLDEVQAGSYALMDVRYGGLDLPFEYALYCLATVISRHGDRAVVDCGLKSVSGEYGLPLVAAPGIECVDLSDEHTRVSIVGDPEVAIGDRLLVVPAHVDPTVNLHDALHVVGDDGIETWPVDGRRSALSTKSVDRL